MNFRVPNLSLRQNLQSLQQTARPASAIGLGIKKNDQFAATRMWKDLLRKFSTEVPQQTHKRQLRSHADTFTGKEALDCVDALLPIIFNKNCKSDTASKVLQNFLDSRYIVNVRDEQSRTFQDNATLYRLNQDRIDCFLGCHSPQAERKRPNSVVRTSSMRDNKKTQFSQPTTEDSFRPGVLPNNQNKIDSSEWQRVHGRLSISCQDVSSISQNMKGQGHSEEPEKKSAARNNLSGIIMDSFNKASSSIMSLHRSASTTKTETRKRANPKFLDDTVLRESVRESKPSRVNLSHHTESQSHNNAPLRIRVRDTTNTSKSVFSTRTNAVASNNVETFGKHKPYLLTTEVSPDSLPTPTFCNRIDKFTYEKQSRSTNDSHLLPLLEAILSNHKISNAEKFKQLRTFRLSYPSIYAQRFPVDSGCDPLMTEEEQNIEPDRGGDFGVGSSIFSNLMRKIAF